MLNSELVRNAHKMAKEIKVQYPGVDYKFQYGLCLSYLLNEKGEDKMESAIETLEMISNEIVISRGFEGVEITRNKWEKKNSDGSVKISRTYVKINFRKNMFQYYINNLTNGVCDENSTVKSIGREFREKVFTFIKENAEELKLN